MVSSKIKEYISIVCKSYEDGKKYDSPNSGISEAIFAYTSGIKLGGKSKYNNLIIQKPIINSNGNDCSDKKINLICRLILRLQFLWIISITFGLTKKSLAGINSLFKNQLRSHSNI